METFDLWCEWIANSPWLEAALLVTFTFTMFCALIVWVKRGERIRDDGKDQYTGFN